MTVYDIPKEPKVSIIYDRNEVAWIPAQLGCWMNNQGNQLSWRELVTKVGPLTTTTPLPPVGTFRYRKYGDEYDRNDYVVVGNQLRTMKRVWRDRFGREISLGKVAKNYG